MTIEQCKKVMNFRMKIHNDVVLEQSEKGMRLCMKDKKEEIEQLEQNVKRFENDRMDKKVLPKEEEGKIHKKVFESILLADIVMAFLYCISLGSFNIETPIFLIDLKVFSLSLIVITILLFETSYRKENGKLAIHGIECLVLSIFMLFTSCIYTIHMKEFHMYVAIASYIFAIYYVGKSIIVYHKMKKQYIASLSDIEEIIKK